MISFQLNGARVDADVNADTPLLYVLRAQGDKSAKFGCGAQQCGTCRVLVDSEPVYACTAPAASAAGCSVETAAGLDTAVRQALVRFNASQCGYCLTGIVVAAEALFRRNPHPSRSELQAALDSQLCRCGSHPRVLRALESIAAGTAGRADPPTLAPRLPSPAAAHSGKPRAKLPAALRALPRLARWIAFVEGKRIVAHTGKVEIGQGVLAALGLIVAEELDVDPGRIDVLPARTDHSPNEGVTAGSMSLETSGAALRQAAAWARRLLLDRAAAELGVPASRLVVVDGEISAPGINAPTDYWQLQAGAFDFEIAEWTREKDPARYHWIGRGRWPRRDLEAKARGDAVFVHDSNCDLHARVVRPPSLRHRLVHLDAAVAAPAELVVDGSFVAVAHPDEYQAVCLAERVKARATWRRIGAVGLDGTLSDQLRRHEAGAFALDSDLPVARPVRAFATAYRRSYSRPFLMHASLAPSAASARYAEGALTVWCASQGIEPLRGVLARLLGMEPTRIVVAHRQGAGCYGHNGADDAAADAALVARALPGKTILLQWCRQDEHKFEPYGPAMRVELGANLDGDGRISHWRHEVWSFTHAGRPSPRSPGVDVLPAWLLEEPFAPSPAAPRLAPESGIHRNALPLYRFPVQEVVKRFVANSPLRTSSLRGLGAYCNVFAIESFMDELAAAADVDPATLRRWHLDHDERARRVLDAAVELAGGLQGPRGMAIARYKNRQCCAAVIVEVAVDDDASIRVQRAWIAADAGRVVDRDGLVNQLEGAFVQALSWSLKEAVAFDADGVTSSDWASYPILRFSEAPRIETMLVDYPALDPLGAGEAAVGPAAAALANAVFAATGIRVRDLPLTPDRLRQAASR